ncbi:TRAP transporter substrate-binding protein DctP [Actinophytocola sp.]|uniref:TRAP transporter substrate-binding protein DctP n=1 Tax=Actinophytocola sp. TaxID=1872138 RepID=UPI003D6B57F1
MSALALSSCGSADDNSGESGEPIELRYASYNPEALSQSKMAAAFMDGVEECTNGQVTFERFWQGSLFGATEVMPAISEGQVDVGSMVTAFQIEALPLWEISGLPFTGDNEVAIMETMSELYESNDLFREQFDKFNVEMLAFHTPGPAATMTREPITSVGDLDGLKLRAVGLIAEAFGAVGAEAVAIDPAEMYEAVERGVIDGIGALPFDTAPSFGLDEVAPHVTNTGIGIYASSGFGINKNVYEELPDSVKECMDEVGDDVESNQTISILEEFNNSACDAFKAAGGSVTTFSEDEIADWSAEVKSSMRSTFVETTAAATGHSTEDIEAFADEYFALYEEKAAASDYTTGMRSCAAS